VDVYGLSVYGRCVTLLVRGANKSRLIPDIMSG
jgi:hypothetical protein